LFLLLVSLFFRFCGKPVAYILLSLLVGESYIRIDSDRNGRRSVTAGMKRDYSGCSVKDVLNDFLRGEIPWYVPDPLWPEPRKWLSNVMMPKILDIWQLSQRGCHVIQY
jgi:hypothetical protein